MQREYIVCDASGEEFPKAQSQNLKTLTIKLPAIKGNMSIDIKKELIQGILHKSNETVILVSGTESHGTRTFNDEVIAVMRSIRKVTNITPAHEFDNSEISSIETAIQYRKDQE